MEKTSIDILWVLICTALVFLMQGGFLCLESGLTRQKNSINVAMKNLADFGVSLIVFWIVGFGLMFGVTNGGIIGLDDFFTDFSITSTWQGVFFLFQAMFCGTAVTILSGAIAERMHFRAYILIAMFVSALIYPVYGHWAWNGADLGQTLGWLGKMGFIDFAGSSVVHSVGGWVSLAALLVIGPRIGKFSKDGSTQQIPGSNLPVASLGVILLWVGWFGFNGGSLLAMNADIPRIIANTLIAGGAGLVSALIFGFYLKGRIEVGFVFNGILGGLVAHTAPAYVLHTPSALLVGGIGGIVVVLVERLLEHFKIDDAVGAVPVHLGAGIWGTLAVGILGDRELLGTGLGYWEQIGVQLLGIGMCFLWSFGLTYTFLRILNRYYPLRVSAEDEQVGLNISEHRATTAILEMFQVMDEQYISDDLSLRVPVEPFTEIGQIALRYNQILDKLERNVQNLKDSNVEMKMHRHRLEVLLEAVTHMSNSKEAFNLLINVINTILYEIFIFETVDVHFAFPDVSSTEEKVFSHFEIKMQVKTDGSLWLDSEEIKNSGRIKVENHFVSKGLPSFLQMDQTAVIISESKLIISIRDEENLQGFIIVRGVDINLNQEFQEFIDMMINSLGLSIKMIISNRRMEIAKENLESLNENLEDKIAERTSELNHVMDVRRRQHEDLKKQHRQLMDTQSQLVQRTEKLNNGMQEMAEAEERFKGLIETASDCIVVVDEEGKIVFVNKETETNFGYSRDEIIGETVGILIPNRYKKNHQNLLTDFFKEPRHRRRMGEAEGDIYSLRKDGSEFLSEISLSPLKTGDKLIVIATIRDITERRRAK